MWHFNTLAVVKILLITHVVFSGVVLVLIPWEADEFSRDPCSVARILWYSRFLFQKRLCVITLDVCIVFILSGFNSYGEGMFLWQLGKLLCKKWVFAVNIAYLRRKQKQIKRGHPESSSVWKRLEKVLIVVWRLRLRKGGDQKETRRLSAGKQICDRVLKFEHERRREKDLWSLKSCVVC